MSAIKTFLLLLALLCAFHPSPLCEAAVYYVKPTEPHNATCPSEPCYTLDEYVSNSTRYFVSNTVFMFLSGYHHLSYNLTVSDVHNITFTPYKEESSIVIVALERPITSILFQLAFDTVIRGMTLQSVIISFEDSVNVTLTKLIIEGDSYFDLRNVYGEVNISHSSVTSRGALIMEWPVPQSQYTTNTVVLLHDLDFGGDGEVFISGCTSGKIVLMNSTFNNTDSAVSIQLSCSDMLFVCENTHFYNAYTHALDIGTSLQNSKHTTISLHNVSFENSPIKVFTNGNAYINISNCYFNGSQSGAITVANSILSLMGNITFIDNNSNRGGAISLLVNSYILIPEPSNTYILFENNTAGDVGGAIYSDKVYHGTQYCKIYIEQNSNKTVFNFSNNTAVNGGNAIYGAYLDKPCYSPNGSLIENSSQLILSVSSLSPSFADDPSVISSDAQNLCLCDKDGKLGDCNGPDYLSVYPGQVFGLPVAALGDINGLVKWPVYATLDQGELSNKLQYSQITSAEKCTYFYYSVLSNESSATLIFSLTTSFHGNYYYLHFIFLLDCPLGFSLSTNYGCECLQLPKNITCNITEQSIQRQGTTWIGVLNSNTTLAFSNVCPLHYCNTSIVKIFVNQTSFLNEDNQCTGNRSGVLCGGCRDNFSLALGSNRCLHGCSNNSLSIVIAFVAAGIALVFFIKILNLTVSQGTINGLIFYANIVVAEQTVLFSSRAYEGFLSVFIAWVNLDLGIETCLFDGMDAYTKAWLQFVFPVYVWVITLFIIILSHYSIRASKLFGNNSVPVLATLILLSYSKLLRAVISALSITHIQFLNDSTMSVWERDGNIQYLTNKHIPLFVFAVAVLILLWFPFTLVLVSIQWLQRGTHYRVLRWITKLRPFFDAFTGPLKDKHRYWVGALLLARCSLLLVFYIYTANGSGVALFSINFATVIILVFLAATGSVYRNYILTIMELSYILNLGMLAIGTLYVWYNSGNLEALLITSVSIAFLQFMATVIYHACVQLREPLMKFQFIVTVINQLKELAMKLKANKVGGQEDAENINGPEHEEYEPLDGASNSVEPLQRPPFQEIPNFREPLLAYLND